VKYLLGYDLGSSFVKAALLNAHSGNPLSAAYFETGIHSSSTGFAKLDPKPCWRERVQSTQFLHKKFPFNKDEICANGIPYQIRRLLCIDKITQPLRNVIVCYDSRIVPSGSDAFEKQRMLSLYSQTKGYCRGMEEIRTVEPEKSHTTLAREIYGPQKKRIESGKQIKLGTKVKINLYADH
jgi:sugar (pentulose or hexulose) kinase